MTWTRSTTATTSCGKCIRRFGSRRADFAPNEKVIKRQARDQAKSLQWWYRERYRLPPNDPGFLALTPADLLLEYWTAYYAAQAARGETLSFEGEDDDYDLDAILAQLAAQDAEANEAAAADPDDAWEPVIDARSAPP